MVIDFFLVKINFELPREADSSNLFHRSTVFGEKLLAWNSFLVPGTVRVRG